MYSLHSMLFHATHPIPAKNFPASHRSPFCKIPNFFQSWRHHLFVSERWSNHLHHSCHIALKSAFHSQPKWRDCFPGVFRLHTLLCSWKNLWKAMCFTTLIFIHLNIVFYYIFIAVELLRSSLSCHTGQKYHSIFLLYENRLRRWDRGAKTFIAEE